MCFSKATNDLVLLSIKAHAFVVEAVNISFLMHFQHEFHDFFKYYGLLFSSYTMWEQAVCVVICRVFVVYVGSEGNLRRYLWCF